MRILIPVDPFLPVPPTHYGGIERVVATLIAQLRRRGHEVGLIAHPHSTASVDFLAAWPETEPNSRAAHVKNMRTVLAAVDRFGPALIHSFARLGYMLPLLPRPIPKIMSYQRPTGGIRTRLAGLIGGSSLAFTGCSEFIAAMGRRHGGSWHAIPNFVDTDSYPYSPTVGADAPLVFLSRIEPLKGPHLAIAAAKQYGRRLLIAGNRSNRGTEGEYWQRQIEPEIGRNGIEYLGPVDDRAKVALLGRAAALIVPVQWDEPFGLVFAEALACGTPVISCPRGALPEIVRDGIDGFLVRDGEAACRAVRGIATIDRSECRRRAETNFSAAAVVPLYERLYRTLTAA